MAKSGPKSRPLRERLLEKMEPVPESGCWLWMSSMLSPRYEYGYIVVGHDTKLLAHRAAWMVFRGPIPKGQQVLHKCDVPSCINPDHLFLGTQRDNLTDMTAKGRRVNGGCTRANEAKTSCLRGHPLSGENLRINKQGGRICLICRRTKDREEKRQRNGYYNRHPEARPL